MAPEPGAKPKDSRLQGEGEAKAAPWLIDLGRFRLDGVGIRVLDHTFARPLALEAGNLKIGFKADARFGTGPVQFNVGEGGAALERIAFTSDVKTLFAVDGVTVEGIKVSLADKHAEVELLEARTGPAGGHARGRRQYRPARGTEARRQGGVGPDQGRPGTRAGPGAWVKPELT